MIGQISRHNTSPAGTWYESRWGGRLLLSHGLCDERFPIRRNVNGLERLSRFLLTQRKWIRLLRKVEQGHQPRHKISYFCALVYRCQHRCLPELWVQQTLTQRDLNYATLCYVMFKSSGTSCDTIIKCKHWLGKAEALLPRWCKIENREKSKEVLLCLTIQVVQNWATWEVKSG